MPRRGQTFIIMPRSQLLLRYFQRIQRGSMELFQTRIANAAGPQPLHPKFVYAPHILGDFQRREGNARRAGRREALARRPLLRRIDENHPHAQKPHGHCDLQIHIWLRKDYSTGLCVGRKFRRGSP